MKFKPCAIFDNLPKRKILDYWYSAILFKNCGNLIHSKKRSGGGDRRSLHCPSRHIFFSMLFSFLSFVDTIALDLLFRYRSTCLNYCCLGKQLIASKSEFWNLKIRGVWQANAYCHFSPFERYRFEVVYLVFVLSLSNHMILCIIMLQLCEGAMMHGHFMRYVVCRNYAICIEFYIVFFFDQQISPTLW